MPTGTTPDCPVTGPVMSLPDRIQPWPSAASATPTPTLRATPPASQPASLAGDAARLFDAVASAVAADHTLTSGGDAAVAAIDVAWEAAQVVSFDVFDTLVVRKVASPRDVFLHLATPAPFSSWGLDATQLATVRQEAESRARQRGATANGSGEVTLHEIHAVMAELLGKPATEVPAMVRAEQLVELALCVAHPYLQTVFARAMGDGKTVWCVSDTYHEAEFLRELLETCGYAVDGAEFISSADCRMSKGEGKLLLAIATEANVPPSAVLHIGDHPAADHDIPREQGFVTVLHPWAGSRHSDGRATRPGDAIALGLSQIAARTVHPPLPFWFRFGYAVAGPLLSGFAFWLHDRLVRDGIDRAYFLLRDGEIMHDVYAALLGDRGGPTTALLESSRRAYMLPALPSGLGAITSQLLACENPMPAREFLERMGVKSAEFARSFRAVGLHADDIVRPADSATMLKLLSLFARTEILTALLARSTVERQALLGYLRQEGVLAPGRIALVDIGWNGTIQKALVAAAGVETVRLDVHGYYLGTLPHAAQDLGGSVASGFLFDFGAPKEHAAAVLQLRQLVEFICTTERGSLRGFRSDGARVVPVHGPVDHSDAQRAMHAALREGVLTYVRALASEQRMFGEQPISVDGALRPLARTIQAPTAEEAAAIGDVRHGDGLGTDRSRSLAAFSPGPFTADSLLRDYGSAYWPAGLLARREPAALALRGLLWMRSGS